MRTSKHGFTHKIHTIGQTLRLLSPDLHHDVITDLTCVI